MAVGWGIGRRNRSLEDYTAGGRKLPGWLTGLSILGTYVSSISFLALPGKAFASNWNSFVFSLGIPLAAWVAVRWFVPFYRQVGHVSAYEHLEQRFGPWARMYASLCYLLTQLARMGTVMYLMALPLAVLLGWDIRAIILVTGLCVTFYTLIGGLTAVIWTDAIQTVVLIAGAIVCGALMIGLVPGGWSEVSALATANDKWSLGSFGTELGAPTFWVVLVYGVVINLQNFGVDQNYVQRYVAAKNDAEARKSVWLGGLLYVPLSAVFFFLGTALFAYYAAHPEGLPEVYRDAAKSDYVFPWFIVTVLPPGLTGLLIAAVFAAAMSTVSTSLNSSATIILNDVWPRLTGRVADESLGLKRLRRATIGWGIAGTLMALAMTQVKSALDAWWILAGVFSGGTLGLFLLGLMSRLASRAAGIAGVAVGVVVILWMTLSPKWAAWPDALRSPFHSFLIIVFGTAAILVTGFLATTLSARREVKS
ncbi:sodium:solute symporter [Actomonas aquatica]